jgi:chorismate mutase
MHTPTQASPMPRTLRLASCLTALTALVLCSCASTPPPLPEKVEPVVDLMAQRLGLARDVAWIKRANNLPVRDPAREAAVLERTLRQADAADLDSAAALRFMRAQIEASCLQQEYWMQVWKNGQGPPPGAPPSLGEIRSRLDSSSARLFAEWAATKGHTIPFQSVKVRLMDAGVSPAAANAAAAGLANTR